jgi:hypothetical protein
MPLRRSNIDSLLEAAGIICLKARDGKLATGINTPGA